MQQPFLQLNCAGKILDLSHPKVMGILNVTPDSFSDGGRYFSIELAVERALTMVKEGAAIIDIGGESSRPGSVAITIQEELDRVIPVLEILRKEISIPISIDTYKPEVMRAAIAAGVDIVNDIKALQTKDALNIVKKSQVAVCLMHMQGEPNDMQNNPHYDNIVDEVYDFLLHRADACINAGIAKNKIIIDPGFGFGKKNLHNLQLLNQLEKLQNLALPILVGWSRKTTVGAIVNQPTEQRLYGSLAAAALAVSKGAKIVRAHDVKPTVDVIAIIAAVQQVNLNLMPVKAGIQS